MYFWGVGGSGKTTVLFKTYIELLKQDNPNLSIWFAAPHEDQVKKLRNDALNSEKELLLSHLILYHFLMN